VIRIPLPDADVHRLEHVFRPATERKTWDHLPIIRLAHRGRPHQDIASDLGISTRTVPRWLNADLDRSLDGLRARKATGQSPALPADKAGVIHRWAIEGPANQGLDRPTGPTPNWPTTGSRRTAARPCRDSVASLPSAPTDRLLRGDPVEKAEAGEPVL
jgi:hypothetical protein